MSQTNIPSLIWDIAELLRGDFRPGEYGRVVLPFAVLRRMDCVLAPTKTAVLKEYNARKGSKLPLHDFLVRAAKLSFYNTSALDFAGLLADQNNIRKNLHAYLQGFSPNVKDIFDRYEFGQQIDRLDEANLLYMVTQRFAAVDLHPSRVSNADMGQAFEELIRRFNELSNETAGDHYTPREVIRLMVDLLLTPDSAGLSKPGVVRSIYDPAAGTGGMLSVAELRVLEMNPQARVVAFGQELNGESYAICKADMLIHGQDVSNILFGNTLSNDGLPGKTFDYMLSNPPFGVEWKKIEPSIRKEHVEKGHHGRFGPGLPRVSDGSMLFLMHLLSKMRPASEGGSRIALVLNGSPLFTGGAGSGESEIRRWILEHDWLEAIVALPTDMFYNTGIATYVWVLSNKKSAERRGKVQLINAVDRFQKMRKSLGSKRKELGTADIETIVKEYGDFEESDTSKIFDNADFGYRTIVVERPLKLNFAVSEERLARLDDVGVLMKLGDALPRLKAALSALGPKKVWKNRDEFQKVAKKAIVAADVSLGAPQFKALWQALSERDDTAHPCVDGKGRPEPDADLRDTEDVPLKEDVQAYVEREVLPHISDAWVDEEKTRVGYEIPFTRHFYRYVSPRALEEIDAELEALAEEIMGLLGEVTA